jgi:hypothetical protein
VTGATAPGYMLPWIQDKKISSDAFHITTVKNITESPKTQDGV